MFSIWPEDANKNPGLNLNYSSEKGEILYPYGIFVLGPIIFSISIAEFYRFWGQLLLLPLCNALKQQKY